MFIIGDSQHPRTSAGCGYAPWYRRRKGRPKGPSDSAQITEAGHHRSGGQALPTLQPNFHLCDPTCSAAKGPESFAGIRSGSWVLMCSAVSRVAANSQERGGVFPGHSTGRESSFLKGPREEGPSKMQTQNTEAKKTETRGYRKTFLFSKAKSYPKRSE